jgi:HEPN domain-containing protein
MNAPDRSLQKKVRRWIEYGNADLRLAEIGFSMGENAPFHLIAFHAQQSVEKYLKGCLVFFGVDVPYTHNLIHLMSLCPGYEEWEGSLQELKILTQYSISTRYPGVDTEVTEQEARDALEIARRAIDTIRSNLKKNGFDFTDEELKK